eukprot:CAMPEP_0183442478 /NCGR_PEP_ID=MMETSP0370-20130417/88386_1 /TAXON_ID=268820 /ORGANISM="Peridinium aciculiferum, Strain PAER-2" /LENGTH=36 /DNA_ID= /DNA_START= /DNA_END= /DNA_ORIENTATION=
MSLKTALEARKRTCALKSCSGCGAYTEGMYHNLDTE